MGVLASAAMKVGLAGFVTAMVLARIRGTKDYRPESFGFVWPAALPATVFVAAYLLWMVATDALVHWRGPWNFEPWQQAPYLASAFRLLAVCILGPIAEELLFRGLVFRWLSERLTIPVVIAITAVSWALLHYTYSWTVIAIIVVDGVLLGLARWRTGSIVTPIVMHAMYNLYAIW